MPLAESGLTHTVTNGPLLVAAAVSALVGLIGFLSPCVLPLVPGYLSYVVGLSGADERPSQRRMIAGALLFVLGFTFVLTATGIAFGALGNVFKYHQRTIEIVFGSITILMGVVFLGGLGFLQREFKIHRLPGAGLAGAPLLGVTFGLAWGPCLTPTYSAVYTLSVTHGTAGRGAFLTVFYCLGLGIPFLLVALGFGWVTRTLGFLRRHTRVVSAIGGGLLVVIGVLLVSGAWDHLMNELRSQFGGSTGFEV